jgi:hypothetical protein
MSIFKVDEKALARSKARALKERLEDHARNLVLIGSKTKDDVPEAEAFARLTSMSESDAAVAADPIRREAYEAAENNWGAGRKIVQITADKDRPYALCDDGAVLCRVETAGGRHWMKLPGVPQYEDDAERNIVQITADNEGPYALCDDGTLWRMESGLWEKVPDTNGS